MLNFGDVPMITHFTRNKDVHSNIFVPLLLSSLIIIDSTGSLDVYVVFRLEPFPGNGDVFLSSWQWRGCGVWRR